MKDAGAVLGVVGGGPGVLVVQAVLERAVDEDRELAGGRGDGFGLADPVGQASIERAQRRLGASRFMAAMRKIAAARLAEGCVFELRSRPPEILLWGARVSQDVKCFSVGQRLMSVPISPSKRRAL